MKLGNAFMRFFSNSFCLNHIQNFAILPPRCGRSSVVERHVANVNVEGSSPFARFHFTPISVFPIGVFYFRGVLKKVKRFAERVAHRAQESETLCRKGGTSRSDNAPLASRACAGAKLACGATLSATREFLGLAGVLNLLVVSPFLRRGNFWGLRGC